MNNYLLHGLEPTIFGDGRPFSTDAGSARVRSLPLPFPSTLAGAVRTAQGRARGFGAQWSRGQADEVLRNRCLGPLLTENGVPLVPLPANGLVAEDRATGGHALLRLEPGLTPGAYGTDLPADLSPCVLAPEVADAFDIAADRGYGPVKEHKFKAIPLEDAVKWLGGEAVELRNRPGPARESRIHVGIDAAVLTAKRGLLYQTEGVVLGDQWDTEDKAKVWRKYGILLRTDAELPGLLMLGGERRAATVRASGDPDPFACPEGLRESLKEAKYVQMMLATPAIFINGFRPQWKRLFPEGPQLELVGLACERRLAVSGWNLGIDRPKAVSWLVPAGAVYFFRVKEGDPAVLADHWMEPVSDEPVHRNDGFGCALWGPWRPRETN